MTRTESSFLFNCEWVDITLIICIDYYVVHLW